MKKKLLCLFLAAIMLCIAACNAELEPEPTSSPDDAQANAALADHATIEYGEPDLILENIGPLLAYIRFPVAGEATDKVIAEWAQSVYQDAVDELYALRRKNPEAEMEVNVQFDSYLVDGRYVGILERGISMGPHLAHPVDIVRTFNIDTESGTLLQNTDILEYAELESILSVLRSAIGAEYPGVSYYSEMDETWLEHLVIGHDGVIVALKRATALPGYLGTVTVTLPYEKLGAAFLLEAEPTPPPSTTMPPTAPTTVLSTVLPTTLPAVPPTNATTTLSAVFSTTPTTTLAPVPFTAPLTDPPAPDIPPQRGDIDLSKPMVAMTFDDGPSKYTAQVLDILERYGGRATFCVVGNIVDVRKDVVRRAYDLGCEIIGHSWDHRDLSKLTADEIRKELGDTSAVIQSVTGGSPKLYRPPYGAVNDTVKSVSAELGYSIINWSVDPRDWESRDADKVYTAVMANVSDRAIVLCHDLHGSTADAMERVIPALVSEGYQLVTVSQLMQYAGKTLEAGVVYYSGK